MSVYCATLLSSELVGPAYVQAQSSSREANHVGLMGRDPGRRRY